MSSLIMIESVITQFLNNLINEGSQKDFIISQNIKITKKDFTVTTAEKGETYRRKVDKFIPAIMREFEADFEPLPNIETAEYSIPISFFVEYDYTNGKVEYNKTLIDIVVFRNKLIGQFYDLTNLIDPDGDDIYNSVWNTSGISGVGNPELHNGVLFDEIDITISVEVGKNVEFGNQTRYLLHKLIGQKVEDKEELPLIIKDSGRTKNMESSQATTDDETSNVSKTNVWGLQLSYYSGGEGEIAKEIKQSAEDPSVPQNQKYFLTIIDPQYTRVDIPVMTDGATKLAPPNEKVIISTILLLANKVL